MPAPDRALQEQLLGRAVLDVLGAADRARLAGRRALVTGAAGSVGSELARQLAAAGVSRLALLDHSEYGLFQIEGQLRQQFPCLDVMPLLADVTRRVDVGAAFDAAAPEVVYHAAAYKHVTYAETAIVQAMRANVLGAAEAAGASRRYGARFVLISSDKAAEPRSVMGATKRFAEHAVLGQASETFSPIVVRFGNILGSSGSVAEIMLARAHAGLNLPVTDPDATRYFMTADEAVALVLKAELMAARPAIFWLDMGQPVRIGDLAQRVIDCVAQRTGVRVGIDLVGLRAGEKVHEDLTTQGLALQRTGHPRIFGARQEPVSAGAIGRALNGVVRACEQGSASAALAILRSVVSDYVPSAVAVAAAAGGQLRARASAA